MAGGFIGTKDGFDIFSWKNVHSGNETKQVFHSNGNKQALCMNQTHWHPYCCRKCTVLLVRCNLECRHENYHGLNHENVQIISYGRVH